MFPRSSAFCTLKSVCCGNQPDEVAGAIDQQDVVVKFLVTTREYGRQHCADGIARP